MTRGTIGGAVQLLCHKLATIQAEQAAGRHSPHQQLLNGNSQERAEQAGMECRQAGSKIT
jgi:hypothetical protein